MSQSLQAARMRRLIRQAFVELVDEKGFTEVTVSDIAARAMINRATFYRYYRDKHHLAEQIFTEIAAEIPLDADPSGDDLADRVRSWTRIFEHFAANAKLFRPLLGRRGDPAFANSASRWRESACAPPSEPAPATPPGATRPTARRPPSPGTWPSSWPPTTSSPP